MKLRTLLLGCGIASSVLYIAAIDVLAPLVHPEYHSYTHRMVSELFAVDSPTRSQLMPAMFTYNLLVLALGVGIWGSADFAESAGRRRAARLAAIAVGAYGAISMTGGLLTPMDVRGTGGLTERDAIHIAATAAQGVAQMSVLVLGALAHGKQFRVYSLLTLMTALAAGAAAGAVASQEPPSAWLGSSERVSIYAWMLWVAVLAITFWRLPEPAKSQAAPAATAGAYQAGQALDG